MKTDFIKSIDMEKSEDLYKIEGIATEYEVIDKTGELLKAGSLDESIDKTIPICVHHNGVGSTIGTAKISKEGNRLIIKGKLYEHTELGKTIAMAKYEGVKYSLSIGGVRDDFEYENIYGKSVLITKKGTIREISIVPEDMQAHQSSIITKSKIKTQEGPMNKEQILKELGVTENQLKAMNKEQIMKELGVTENQLKAMNKEQIIKELGVSEELLKGLDKIKDMEDQLSKANDLIKNLELIGTKGSSEKMEKAYYGELNSYVKTGAVGQEIKKSLNTDPSSGGALLPTNKAKEIIKEILETSPVFKMARSYTINKGNTLTIRVKVKGANNAGNQVEGVAAGIKSGSTYEPLVLEISKLTDAQEITQEMIDDAEFDAMAEVLEDSRENIAEIVSDRVWNGVLGINQKIEGIYTNTAVQAKAQVTETVGTITANDLKTMITNMPKNIRSRSKFLVSTAALTIMRKWVDANGRPLYTESLVSGDPGMFGGHKVEEDSYMQDLVGGNFPVFFGDMKKFYATITRKGVTIERERNADKDIYETYVRTRIGGKLRQISNGNLLKVRASTK